MQRRTRYLGFAFIILIALFAFYRKYSPVFSIDSEPVALDAEKEDAAVDARESTNTNVAPPPAQTRFGEVLASARRANATFIMLARNSDLEGALSSVRALEDRFNHRFNYPYVFLNEEEFSVEFKRRIRNLTPSRVEFGVIPKEHWFQPDWIDKEKAQKAMEQMERQNVKYGGNIAYHNMCRYNSGFFFKHPLVQPYRWYWRVEPKVKFHCDIHQDPFLFMEDNDKVYGFTLAVYEIPQTIRSLWGHVKDFMDKHPSYIRTEDNALDFISADGGRSYNRCHFWSNFEIASLDFWRSEPYTRFFEYLDRTGGFYYERWGDAPIHSLAAALFLPKSKIHLFDEIGYQHDDWSHCPKKEETWVAGRCACSKTDSFDYSPDSCRRKWDALGVA
ncbi:glycosyltransferase family 15 protein [Mycena leptocephala]|nr:glycosyltransferase family 15 protein [Mycena leptocephala]